MRYWCFDRRKKKALGPYTPEELRKLPNFGPKSTVAPETAQKKDQWMKARDIAELRRLLDQPIPPPDPPPENDGGDKSMDILARRVLPKNRVPDAPKASREAAHSLGSQVSWAGSIGAIVGGIGMIIVVVLAIVMIGSSRPTVVDKKFSHPSQPKPQIAQTRSSKGRAIRSAKTLVSEKLIAPSTAQLVSSKVVASHHPYYLVHIVVDSQNAFGAMLRGSYLVSVKLGEGDTFRYNDIFGMQKCENPPRANEIFMSKNLNKWPGTNKD